jgi:hypothetical protein
VLQDNTGSYILTEPTKNGGKADVWFNSNWRWTCWYGCCTECLW